LSEGSWWTCTLPSPSAGRVRVVVIQRSSQEESFSFNSSACAVFGFHQEMKDLLDLVAERALIFTSQKK
ncbi:MAG: hypothetical protein VKJ63_05435, partial [Synechococcus sp.]|nr:hypothetical protein [Synechococcus sp.]